ncbi:methyl-accepting chemotaxis protein [Roseobacter weihaiensis]|uniref:methyl-accepting chemotaxis protein n=1 Tax=Roseobacter weihaiensis TaxID=2763262 RepID=UPI001D09E50B|nr:methyl-accepting chemotaxis protein [Roseobacter sp. H9]
MNILGKIGVGGRLCALVILSIAGIFAMQRASIVTFEDASIGLKETELTHLTDVAISIVESYYAQAQSGELSQEEAQSSALAVLEGLRYEGDNYYWVTDRNSRLLMHGVSPHLVGRDFSGFTDPNGVYLFDDMVDGTADGTPATVAYQWAAPNAAEGDPPVDKLAVVQPFEAWDWVLGTGAYLTRIEVAQASIKAQLDYLKFLIAAILVMAAAGIAYSVTHPIRKLTNRMAQLSDGDTETAVPYSKDQTVFGEISRALEIFRTSMIERAKMLVQEKEREKEAREKEALEAQQAREKEEQERAESERAQEEERLRKEQAQAERERIQQAEMAEREARVAKQNKVVEALGTGLQRLAAGDLSENIDEKFPEDYEKLRHNFNAATNSLRDAISAVMQNAESIQNEAGEITSASDDLSRRTEKQAATLEETAAALDELTSSVKSASEGVEEASEMSSNAKSNAQRGGEVAEKAVEAMDGIKTSSEQISKITQVIDDIAFQTNLLSLNAGVEAARAGEAGRGFAVVATEVRALAQRSSEAAQEIRTLISESSTQVEKGYGLVGETGKALAAILGSVTEISDRMSQIAASAREQSVGINEINTAVNALDHNTQQNAAMFEETTAASHALTQEAGALVKAVSKFSLDQGKKTTLPNKGNTSMPAKETSPSAPAVRSTGSAALAIDDEPGNRTGWEEF